MNRIIGIELETVKRTIAALERAAAALVGSEEGEAARVAARVLTLSVQPQPDQEPVAWMRNGWGPDCGPYTEFYREDEMWRPREGWTPLYAAPQLAPDERETWGIPHASTIRCLRAAEDRIRAGDDPAEVFADFGWAMVRNELRCSEVLRRAGHSVSGMCLECGKGPCLLRAPAPQPALVTLIEEKIAGMTPTEVAQFMRDRAALREQPEQEPVAHVVVMETGGNAGLATRIVEIDDPFRERLRPGTKLYTAPQPAPDDKLREAAWRTLEALRGFAYHGRAEDWTDAASALREALEGK